MTPELTPPVAGIELASVVLPSERAVFMVMAGSTADGEPLVELATWRVDADGNLVRPSLPLELTPAGLTVARELVAQACEVWEHVDLEADPSPVLGRVDAEGGNGADGLWGGYGDDPDTLVGDAGNDSLDVNADDVGYGGAGDDYLGLDARNTVAMGEDGNDDFVVQGGAFGTVTGGFGADSLEMGSFFEAGTQTRVVFTDFVDGQDRVFLAYPVSGGNGRDKADFINALDTNGDYLISRADGASGAAAHESFAFSRDSAGESVLTLNFAEATFVLEGANYLV